MNEHFISSTFKNNSEDTGNPEYFSLTNTYVPKFTYSEAFPKFLFDFFPAFAVVCLSYIGAYAFFAYRYENLKSMETFLPFAVLALLPVSNHFFAALSRFIKQKHLQNLKAKMAEKIAIAEYLESIKDERRSYANEYKGQSYNEVIEEIYELYKDINSYSKR